VARPRLLLVASFTELEWGIRPALEEWAEVAAFDMPGVGGEPLPPGMEIDASRGAALLAEWRAAAAERGLAEVDDKGWDRFVLVTDSHGTPAAVALAKKRPDAVQGLAIGHASLSHGHEGDRAPMRAGIWDALVQLLDQGHEAFVRYGIAQMTRGGISEDVADQMLERFPDSDLLLPAVKALGQEPEPIGDDLGALGLPLLLAKHEGCLGRTDEGFEDIVKAFPEAETVICPETCTSSPAFAQGLAEFSEVVS
jgi:pimeloyl-ACP methyl ester carboxylesterase